MAAISMVTKSNNCLIVRSIITKNILYKIEANDTKFDDCDDNIAETLLSLYQKYRIIDEDVKVEKSSDEADGTYTNEDNLPQCKIKRNYICTYCKFATQNPRHHLAHLRDVHGEQLEINSCEMCLYASRHFQKLVRHMKMVHRCSKDVCTRKRQMHHNQIIEKHSILPKNIKYSESKVSESNAPFHVVGDAETVPISENLKIEKPINEDYLQQNRSQFENYSNIDSKQYSRENRFLPLINSEPLLSTLNLERIKTESTPLPLVNCVDKAIKDLKNIQSSLNDEETTHTTENNVAAYFAIETGTGYGKIITKMDFKEKIEHNKKLKKVFKCEDCQFWASSVSRFHVHIVGHLNRKPFECSLCAYRSNWRWDITKHIKLKALRDSKHEMAQVLMNDKTGRRNYTKYNKFVALISVIENIKIDKQKSENNKISEVKPKKRSSQSTGTANKRNSKSVETVVKPEPISSKASSNAVSTMENDLTTSKKLKELKKKPHTITCDGAVVPPFRCGHCHQGSNWKHVIKRHCNLKHRGVFLMEVFDTENADFCKNSNDGNLKYRPLSTLNTTI